MIARTIEATAEISQNIISADATFTKNKIDADAVFTSRIQHTEFPAYDGETAFTPSAEAQTIPVKNTVLLSDITINPIPSNYGLITWNGSTLTVS